MARVRAEHTKSQSSITGRDWVPATSSSWRRERRQATDLQQKQKKRNLLSFNASNALPHCVSSMEWWKTKKYQPDPDSLLTSHRITHPHNCWMFPQKILQSNALIRICRWPVHMSYEDAEVGGNWWTDLPLHSIKDDLLKFGTLINLSIYIYTCISTR